MVTIAAVTMVMVGGEQEQEQEQEHLQIEPLIAMVSKDPFNSSAERLSETTIQLSIQLSIQPSIQPSIQLSIQLSTTGNWLSAKGYPPSIRVQSAFNPYSTSRIHPLRMRVYHFHR